MSTKKTTTYRGVSRQGADIVEMNIKLPHRVHLTVLQDDTVDLEITTMKGVVHRLHINGSLEELEPEDDQGNCDWDYEIAAGK